MTWTLSASGHCPETEEQELARAVGQVLAKYGCIASHMAGASLNGPVHNLPAPEKAAKSAE